MAFAEKLVAVRRAHDLTQDQLAAKLFVTRQHDEAHRRRHRRTAFPSS